MVPGEVRVPLENTASVSPGDLTSVSAAVLSMEYSLTSQLADKSHTGPSENGLPLWPT